MIGHFKKKIKYQSWHRGTRELETLLGRFYDHYEDNFIMSCGVLYCDFLQEEDTLMFDWFFKNDSVLPKKYEVIVQKIKEFYNL